MVTIQIGINGELVDQKISSARTEINEAISQKASAQQVTEMAGQLVDCTNAVQEIKTAHYVSQGTLDTMKATIDNSIQGVSDEVIVEINRQAQHVQTIIGWADESESVLDRLTNLGNIANSAVQTAAAANSAAQSAVDTAQHAAQGQIDEATVRAEVVQQLQGLDVVSQSQLQGAINTEIINRGLATVNEITDPQGNIMVNIVANATPGVTTAVQGNVQGYVDSAHGYATQASVSFTSAEQAAQGAINSANNATAAQGAAETARNAAESAQGVAQGAATSAQGSATSAAGSASAAADSASAARAAQGMAQGYANAADAAKANAQNAASNAQNWAVQAHNDYIAVGASIQDGIVQGVTSATNSIVQEVGDMIEGVMENTADLVDFDSLAIPVEQSEDSANTSFNELVSKLQEKPVRRADVLKKVIDEDTYYWYVMPIIDQRIYRDTVISVNGQQVTVEYGWQKAVKERYWYHKQDSNIRDHYIYLFRTDINSLVANTSNNNTIVDGLPKFLPLSGENRKLRTPGEIPSDMCVVGAGRQSATSAGQRPLSPTGSVRGGTSAGTKTSVPISPAMTAKTGKTIPSKFNDDLNVDSANSFRIDGNGTMSQQITGDLRKTPFVTRNNWNSATAGKQPYDSNYPSDFYYIGCYAECDDNSMYENWMYTSNTIFELIANNEDPGQVELPTRCIDEYGVPTTNMKRLSKRDDGSWYGIYNDGNENREVTVGSKYRDYFFEYQYNGETKAFAKVGSKLQSGDEYRLQRRPFADVSRDIQVHMLPIYLLGSTGIAIDSDDVDGDGKYNYVTIDSMLTPPSGSNSNTVNDESDIITIGTGSKYSFVCKDNIAVVESGLPCVYGQGYTWLPLDAKGDADDEGGLGVHCDYIQDAMWNAAGIYAAYNGLIPSGYTKSTLKSMSTMYKYKIIEKFMLGQWSVISGEKQWISGANDIAIFTDDYSEDGLADLNETIYDINIVDGLITYTIKENYLTKQETGGNAGVTHSDFVTNTLSYLTQDGSTNTNNIFLICVEDDGDEYIFDEYIYEKGKVFKLNEQKRLKYSEELRRIEYENVFGLQSKRYTGGMVPGNDDTEQTNNIMDYLCEETLVDTGITVPNPDYRPAIPEQIGMLGTLGGSFFDIKCNDHGDISNCFNEIMKTGVIEAIAFAIKYRLFEWDAETLISSDLNPDVINELVGLWNLKFEESPISADDKEWLKNTFIPTAKTGVCKLYWDNISRIVRDDFGSIIDLLVEGNAIGGVLSSAYNINAFKDISQSLKPTDAKWVMIDLMIAIMMFYTIKSETWNNNPIVNGVGTIYNNSLTNEISSSVEKITRKINNKLNGHWCAIPKYGTFKDCKFNVDPSTPASGNPTISVKETQLIARQTQSTADCLQRYNKILAFLIKKNNITQDSSVYEWIYACYRYMPASKTYINIGNRSFIGTTAPTKAKMNEVSSDNASNTSSTEQTQRLIQTAKQDIYDRMASFESEDALLNRMPRLKAILQQCFAEETVQGVTTYKLAGVPSTGSFNELVTRMNNSETNMANMASAVNQGKRVVMAQGVVGASDDNIFSNATVNSQSQPTQDQSAAMETETMVTPNVNVQQQTNESRSYTTVTKTVGGSQQTVLTRAARL